MSGAVTHAAQKLAGAKKLWFLWWAAQTALALLASLPLAMAVTRYLDHSRWADELLVRFEFSVIAELQRQYGGWLNASAVVGLLAGGLVTVWWQMLLSGGVIAWLRRSEGRPVVRETLRDGAGWFWPMARLTVWALIGYGLVLTFDSAVLGRLADKYSDGTASRAGWIALHVRLAVIALLAIGINVAVDYARVRMVALERRSAWRALSWSRGFVLSHPGSVAGPWLAVALLMASFFVVKSGLDWLTLPSNMGLVWLGVLVQQTYVLSRIWTKLMFWATANEVYTKWNPPYRPPAPLPAPPPAEEIVAVEGLA
jgi:hypothetical protein